MNINIVSMAAGLTAAAATLGACGAHHVPELEQGRTELDMRLVAEGISTYQARYDELPQTFEAVCNRMPWWCRNYLPRGFRPEDAWNQPFDYEIADDHYRLRSAGPDKHLRTPDDIVFDTAAARSGFEGLAGCYAIDTANESLDGTVLKLTGDSVAFNTYIAAPSFRYYEDPVWQPQAADSLHVSWPGPTDGFGLVLVGRDTALAGTLVQRWIDGEVARWAVRAQRVGCE